MYDVTKVRNALNGQVGWENPVDPDYAIVDATNQGSTSGRLFTDNKYVKIQYLKDTQDYSKASDPEFNAFLQNIQKEAITTSLDRVFNESDFRDRQLLYQYANNKTQTDTLPAGFVGYKITPSHDANYTFEIVRDILEFSGTGDITLQLYNSGEKDPIFEETVSITSELQEVELGWKLDNSNTYFKGEYYYGYLTDALTVVPYKRDYQLSNVQSNIDGLCVENIQASSATGQLWDLEDTDGASESWGLNPDFLVYDDLTDFIIQNKRLFSYAIQLQGQIQSINVYLASLRSNRNERFSENMIKMLMIELDAANSENWNKKGLRGILSNEITRLKEEVIRLQRGYNNFNEIQRVVRS